MKIVKRSQSKRWNPFEELERLEEKINRLFGLTPLKLDEELSEIDVDWIPRVNVAETGNEYIITADLPGVDLDDINVSFEDGVLTISGERKYEKEEKDEKRNYLKVESVYGSFERRISIPGKVKENEIKATYKKGILKIILPKAEEAKAKKIKVKVEE